MAIRIYLVEDHPVMRDTLQDYLALTPDLVMCGMAEDAEVASAELGAAEPDVVVVDLSLPGRSGLELLDEIQTRWGIPCVIMSGHGERSYVLKALAAGARGYVLKGHPRDLPVAIRAAMNGGIHLSEALREPLDDDSGASET